MSLDWEKLIPHLAHDARAMIRKGLTNAQLLERKFGANAEKHVPEHLHAIIKSQLDLNQLFARIVLLADAETATKRCYTRPDGIITFDLALGAAKLECRDAMKLAGAELEIEGNGLWCEMPKTAQTVFVELIENSIRFRHAVRPLQMSLKVDVVEGKCSVRFQDNGTGIDPTYAANLFEPFQRLDAKRSGFGLGLAIARCIVEATGGTITFEPLSIGTAFKFELPATP